MIRYQTGQQVEVRVIDFATPGMPEIWVAGTVDRTEAQDNGLTDVFVRRTQTGGIEPRRVGKRGGNPRLRPV
jgi:hypothetical protein